MPPGPKPKPREIRVVEGSVVPSKHDRIPTKMGGTPGEDFLEPPESLCDTAKQFWRDSIPTLARVGLLDTVDKAALEMMATQYARAKQAGRVVDEQGHLARGSTGQLAEHPSLRTERDAASAFLRFAEQYALTPVARTRLGIAELQRRTLTEEMDDALGAPDLRPA